MGICRGISAIRLSPKKLEYEAAKQEQRAAARRLTGMNRADTLPTGECLERIKRAAHAEAERTTKRNRGPFLGYAYPTSQKETL